MSDTNDGGPAFPCEVFGPMSIVYRQDGLPCENHGNKKTTGMTLRDWFAGQALAIIAAIPVHETGDVPALAREAYNIADAMLAAREETR